MSAPAQLQVARDDEAQRVDLNTEIEAAIAAASSFLVVARRPATSVSRSLSRGTHTDRRDRHQNRLDLPCRHDPALWFAEGPAELERAKTLCTACPVRLACLAVAVNRAEYAGVWGGHIFDRGRIVPRKRPPGRPRKNQNHSAANAAPPLPALEHNMTANATSTLERTTQGRVHNAAARLYDAECALHAAHQSHVTAWIDAAAQKLQDAVTEYLAAVAGSRAATE